MDANCACNIIINNDSEFRNINDGSNEEYYDVSKHT